MNVKKRWVWVAKVRIASRSATARIGWMPDRCGYACGVSGSNRQFPVLRKPNCGITRPMNHLRNSRHAGLAVALFLTPLLLAGCGSSDQAPSSGKAPELAREFGEEDKQAALALSIGSVQALSAETSAYARSLSCSIALESVSTQLAAGGQLDTEMVNAIEQVRTVYNNRVQQLGSAEGKSAAEIAADRVQRVEELPEQSERGQIAIGCLRAMA